MSGTLPESQASGGAPSEILIRPLAGRQVIAVGVDDGSGQWSSLPTAVATTVRALLNLADNAPVGQRRFVMSETSLFHWDHDVAHPVGQFYRGVLTDSNGLYTHQVQLREAPVPQGLDVMSAANAVQIAAMQAQLDHLQSLMERGLNLLEAIKGRLEIEQAAQANSAIATISRVYSDSMERGSVGNVDWSRVAHLEQILLAGLDAVEQELQYIVDNLRFTGDVYADERAIAVATPDRIVTLVQMHLGLENALRRWTILMATRKHECLEVDNLAAERLRSNLDLLSSRRDVLLGEILRSVHSAPKAHGQDWWKLLATKGLIMGWMIEEKKVNAVESYKSWIRDSDLRRHAVGELGEPCDHLRLLPFESSSGSDNVLT